jgi:hypothetical protein
VSKAGESGTNCGFRAVTPGPASAWLPPALAGGTAFGKPRAAGIYLAPGAAGAIVGTLPRASTTRLAIRFSIAAPFRRLLM